MDTEEMIETVGLDNTHMYLLDIICDKLEAINKTLSKIVEYKENKIE